MTQFAIVSVGQNCDRFLNAWYASITAQTHKDWVCYVVLDPSTDRSVQLLTELISNSPDRFVVQYNSVRQGNLRNTCNALDRVEDPETVVVTLDMDDALNMPQSLDIVANAYRDKRVWFTYGTWVASDGRRNPFCNEIPDDIWRTNSHRKSPWSTSHLRTFKKWLFDKIGHKHLQFEDGSWYMRAADRAMTYPMLEMCSKENVRFIREVIYRYNVYGQQQAESAEEERCLKHILQRTSYRRLVKGK